MNQRTYERYRRYGADFDIEVFQLPMTDSFMIHMPLKGSPGFGGGGSFSPGSPSGTESPRTRRIRVQTVDGTGGQGGPVVGPGDSGLPRFGGCDVEDEQGEAAPGRTRRMRVGKVAEHPTRARR